MVLFTRMLWPLLALLLSAPALAADTLALDSLTIPRAMHAPRLDDYVSGVPDDAGLEVSTFRQNAPGDGEPASLSTRAYLSYDDTHLYAVFVCKDDPKLLRARIARREDIFGDEGVQILIDSFHDKQRAFVFSANPYGVQLDSKYTEGLGYDFNYDTQWTSDGRITADGYVVTMQIPFKSLRFRKGDSQNWGLAVGRIIPRTNEFVYWPYITQRKEGFVPQFGTAHIDDTISPGRNIQIIPYASYRNTRALGTDAQGNAAIVGTQKLRAGVDAKFVISDALALDLTANPDFGEIESDEPQVIVNKRFEVQFPEKRPFFIENSGFFGTPYSLFFSRRIVDPQYGARLTGRLGRWALGGLLIDDRQADNSLPGNHPDAGERGQIAVARVQRDFGTQSNIGVLLSNRDIGDHGNRVFGVDTRIKLNDNWTFSGQAVGSQTRDPVVADFNGHLLYGQFARSGRHFSYDGQYVDISQDFNTELGFVPRTNIRQLYQSGSYLWLFPDAPWLISVGPSVTASRTWDQDGELQDWSVDSAFIVNGLRFTKLEGHWIESYERYGGEFRKHGWLLGASSEWLSWLTANVRISGGEQINYNPAPNLAPFLGDARQAEISLTLKPTTQLRIDQAYIWNDLRTREPLLNRPEGARVFSNLLSRTKINYQFNRFLSARVVLDYAGLTPDDGLFWAERSKRLTGDVLVSYVLSPGTALYVGYTDRQENLRLFAAPGTVGRTRDLDLHSGRQFFVKLSYLFNY